jgi:hypothetical protein
MTTYIFAITFLGLVLGLRGKVLVLAPATLMGMAPAAVAGVVQDQALWSIMLTLLLVATSLQLGYLAGAATWYYRAAIRLSHLRAKKPAAMEGAR